MWSYVFGILSDTDCTKGILQSRFRAGYFICKLGMINIKLVRAYHRFSYKIYWRLSFSVSQALAIHLCALSMFRVRYPASLQNLVQQLLYNLVNNLLA